MSHPQSKTLADNIHGQLIDGADFAVLAKRYSTDSSKDVGGELTIWAHETVPQFEKTALALKVNEPLEPVKTCSAAHHPGARAAQLLEVHLSQTRGRKSATRSSARSAPTRVTRWLEDPRVRGQDRVRVRLRTPGHVARRGHDRDRLSLRQARA